MKHTQREKQQAKRTLHHQLQRYAGTSRLSASISALASGRFVGPSETCKRMLLPCCVGKRFGGRVFCHSAHTRPSMRGENHFFGGRKTTRPKTGRRPQQKTNGAREPKRNRKAPGWVTAGKTPNKKQEQRGSQVSGLRGQQPQPAQKRPRPCRRKGPRRQRGRRGAGHP